MNGNPVLVLEESQEKKTLRIEYLLEENLPESLNGESGFHIYHVRMITELLLRELCEMDSGYSFTEKQITDMAVASSLHDIGKMNVPKSILEFPGKLSPIQFDIVKKHTVFGENIIFEADNSAIDGDIVKYAVQIARSHHERIDHTGYPDGLGKEEIPVCAQVVSLADSYDALTSSRSYKDAYSQDVALQMISSGMCGIFDDVLVEALLRVVNHASLVSLRENLMKKRLVVEEIRTDIHKRVLCIGNTGYLTNEFVENTFPESKVMVVGNSLMDSADKIRLFRIRKPSVKAILETYEFDLIVFFSSALSFQTNKNSDAEFLRELLGCANELKCKAKILYLSPLDSSFKESSDKAILSSAGEKLCEFYAKHHSLEIKIVQIPYLYSGVYKKDFLYETFCQLYEKKTVTINESPMTRLHFISLADLSELITRISENWKSGAGILSVCDEFRLTFSDFADALRTLADGIKTEFTKTDGSGVLNTSGKALRNEYGWFAKISIIEDIEYQFEKFLETKQKREFTLLDKIKLWISRHMRFVKIAELILMFLFSELMILLTDSAVIFSIVDFRTIFIVIMATLYGLPYGLASATLSSITYFIAKVASGTNAMTIFYEPTNWLAFVFFYLIGAICGYVNLRKDDNIKNITEQNELLEEKLVFTREIFEDTLKEKKELKKQIIGSKDSFGKIFYVTRKLNTVVPQQLYLRSVEIFEEFLENKSISIYSIGKNNHFGRLEVASRDLVDVVSRSISTKTYEPVISRIKDGEIWKNTSLDADMPMYAAGVYRQDELVLLIFLWHADLEQRSLYYVNLFKILRDLVQMSLLRAYDYNNAILEKQYIAGTNIMTCEYFEECLENYKALAEKKVSSYILMEFDLCGNTLQEASNLLAGKIRTNDILGITADGKLRLILSQAKEDDLGFILPRFENLPIKPEVIKS